MTTMLLHELVERNAASTPEAPAVVCRDDVWTYARLNDVANGVAQVLQDEGLRAGDRVAIHGHKSLRAVATMIGVLRAGGVYVPVDPLSPPSRAQRIIRDSGATVVAIDDFLRGAIETEFPDSEVLDRPLLQLRADDLVPQTDAPASPSGTQASSSRRVPWQAVKAALAEIEPVPRTLDDPAYMLYTSGTTGHPKGVVISHRNAMAFVEWAAQLVDLQPSDRLSNHAPFHFDLSVFDIYAAFYAGASVVILGKDTKASPRSTLDTIESRGVTVWYSVPSALLLLVRETDRLAEQASGLRAIIFAGEVFPMYGLRRLMRTLPDARYFNFFGPTETNVCLYHELESVPEPDATAIPIGRPASGDQIEIRTHQQTPARNDASSDGADRADAGATETGELMVTGPTVMLGYWNGENIDPSPNPYPTGDIVSQRDDREIMYHGRRDHMVKVRGYRIELGEVESALHEHDAIRRAIAFAEDDALSVAIETTPSLSVLDVKQHCARLLPRYMIPHTIHFLNEVPLTSTGKPDRLATQQRIQNVAT